MLNIRARDTQCLLHHSFLNFEMTDPLFMWPATLKRYYPWSLWTQPISKQSVVLKSHAGYPFAFDVRCFVRALSLDGLLMEFARFQNLYAFGVSLHDLFVLPTLVRNDGLGCSRCAVV